MKPLDAWRIISADLKALYKLRGLYGDDNISGDEVEAEAMCYKALTEMDKGIVHCKDCVYRKKTNTGLGFWYVCHKLNRNVADEFYCAYGEEKDDNAD